MHGCAILTFKDYVWVSVKTKHYWQRLTFNLQKSAWQLSPLSWCSSPNKLQFSSANESCPAKKTGRDFYDSKRTQWSINSNIS